MMREMTRKGPLQDTDNVTGKWLDKKLSEHLDTMINMIISEYNIDS